MDDALDLGPLEGTREHRAPRPADTVGWHLQVSVDGQGDQGWGLAQRGRPRLPILQETLVQEESPHVS